MSQIAASFSKTLKEFFRERAVLFWTIAWPVVWVIISSFTFTGGLPAEIVPYAKGDTTISMMVLSMMLAGISNLPAGIAQDRENGLLSKLKSMPVNPRHDFTGRILAMGAFSAVGAGVVIAVGVAIGARFNTTPLQVGQAIGFLILIIGTAAGIGLLIGTFIRRLQGAIATGVGFSIVTAALSGIFAPYELLPPALQAFSRTYPISAAATAVKALLIGEELASYPLTQGQVTLTFVIAAALITVGVIVYSRLSWRSE